MDLACRSDSAPTAPPPRNARWSPGRWRSRPAPLFPIPACALSCSRGPGWRCSTRERWDALTTTGRSWTWRAPAGHARATTWHSVFRHAATGRRSCGRLSRRPTPTSRWSRSPTKRRCRRASAPPTFISSACSPNGRASWCHRSSSARWPSGGPCSTQGQATRRSHAGSRLTTSASGWGAAR